MPNAETTSNTPMTMSQIPTTLVSVSEGFAAARPA